MPVVVGVTFKKVGKVYYFDPAGLDLREGDSAIAETARGMEFGEVIVEPKDVPDEEVVPPLKKIVRKATPADIDKEEANREKEKTACSTCQQKIEAHSLPMKLIDAEYCFDGSQVTFYFSAESRVDFRGLVKDLAGTLKTKVQLHQVGVRDEAKLFGGMGPCGRHLCCSAFLSGFEPVSMKMAKEQSLFLNPLKFSGICGKLMCCLRYEYAMYKEVKARLPAVGTMVQTPRGEGKVVEVNVIKETLSVQLDEGLVLHCPAAEFMGAEAETSDPGAKADESSADESRTEEGAPPQEKQSPKAADQPSNSGGRRRRGRRRRNRR